ncbi:MAG TPA: Calx-beta domain-containing protein [Pyrinomonadaceae bacterium]
MRAAGGPPVELVSVIASGNGSGNSQSIIRSISSDGRYVLFDSFASNLVANDGNNTFDAFVRDMQTQNTFAVSLNSAGTGTANGNSSAFEISADGRYVLFGSFANNIVANDANGAQDLFVRDMLTGTTTLVTFNSAGTGSANDNSYGATISANGRYVAFLSTATNLVSNDTNGTTQDAFVRDMLTGTTKLVSINSSGNASRSANSVVISADGRFVAFGSTGTDLVANMSLTFSNNIFLHDLQTNTTALVSVNSAGNGGGNSDSSAQALSSDGRFVAFESFASNLTANDNNSRKDVFLRDMQTGTTTLISVNSSATGAASGNSTEPAISANGRYVAFLSEAANLVSNDNNGTLQDVFVRDTQTGTTSLVSINSASSGSGNSSSSGPIRISSDGQRIAFTSQASNLIGNDTNGSVPDVFVRDLQAGTTILASINSAGNGSGNSSSTYPSMSADGRYVAFMSGASDLVINDTNGNINDIFRFTVPSGTTSDRLRFSASAYSVGEADGSVTITVERIGSVSDTVTATYSTSGGTATGGADYTVVSGTLTFAPGETSKTFSVSIINDSLNEIPETVGLSLSDNMSSAVLTIQDDDPLPSLSINDITLTEGNSGETNAIFTVTITPVSGRNVSVLYSTVPQGAVHPNDYKFINGVLNFAPGETTKSITVPVIGDTAFEGNETFDMVISNPVGAVIADDRGVCTIVDDDSAPGISINDLTVTEGDAGLKEVTFTVSLSAASNQQIGVSFTSESGTAKENTDYSGVSGGMLFFPGITKAIITVPIRGDLLDEPDETFSIRLYNPINNAVITKAVGVCTILDDDAPPALTINDVGVVEGDSGTTSANFTVSLSAPSGKSIMIDYAASNGTATSGEDYAPASGTLTIAPGDLIGTITVPINGDSIDELDETFTVNLANPQNVTLSDSVGTGTIVNDESASIQFSVDSLVTGEGVVNTPQGFNSLSVTIVRTGDNSTPANVQYLTSDSSGGNECNQVTGNASQRCDYGTQAGTVRFSAGETTKTIQVPIVNDTYQEGVEVFTIKLHNPTGTALGRLSQLTVTISDDATDAVFASGIGNPYLSNNFFVRMNYLDFLAREPDNAGFTDWTTVLNNCGPQKGFLGSPFNCDRAHVSHGFIASAEFTDRGYFMYRMYEVALSRLPRYNEFVPDMAAMSGAPNSPELEQNSIQFANNFTNRQEFINKFADVSSPAQAAQLIARLEQNAGVALPEVTTTLPGQPPQYNRQDLINKRASGEFNLGQTLKAFVEQKVVYDKFFERGFVTMQYFGYLRRDPDLNDPNLLGWTEWVYVFTNGGATRGRPDIGVRDYHHLVFGFIYSEEYRKRFGAP